MSYRHDLPLFHGTESAEDMFLATMSELDKDLVNELKVDHALYQYLKDNKLIKYQKDISTDITFPLLDKPNSTVKDMTGYDDMDLTPQDATSSARYLWGHVSGTQMYNREELVKNSGKYQLMDLIEVKTEQLKTSINNHFSDKLRGEQDCDGRSILGIGRIMKPGAVVGQINPATAGYAYWDVQQSFKNEASKTKWALATDLRKGLRHLRRSCSVSGMAPDVYFCGEDAYDALLEDLENKIQMTPEQANTFKGYEALAHNNLVYIYDSEMPAKKVWAMNFKDRGIELRIHADTNFSFQPWESTAGKIQTKHRNCLLYAAVVCRKRNLNGVLEFA